MVTKERKIIVVNLNIVEKVVKIEGEKVRLLQRKRKKYCYAP